MSILIQLIVAIASSLPSLLSAGGVISPGLGNLISASLTAIDSIVSALRSGGTVTAEVSADLAALQAEYAAIQKDTSADPVVIGKIAEISNLVDYALQGWSSGVDPSTLPIPPEVA